MEISWRRNNFFILVESHESLPDASPINSNQRLPLGSRTYESMDLESPNDEQPLQEQMAQRGMGLKGEGTGSQG